MSADVLPAKQNLSSGETSMHALPSLYIALLTLGFSGDAAAYLDPGTGSMVLQGLIAGIAVAWFTIKTYWYRITGFFGKEQPTSVLDSENETADPKDNA